MSNDINVKFYSIGEVSRIVEEAPSTLRYWEKEFDQVRPLTTDFGRRVYTEQQINVIQTIKKLLHEEGLTIKGAKNYLAKAKNNESTTLNFNGEQKQQELTEVKSKLNDLLSYIRKGKQN